MDRNQMLIFLENKKSEMDGSRFQWLWDPDGDIFLPMHSLWTVGVVEWTHHFLKTSADAFWRKHSVSTTNESQSHFQLQGGG